MNKEQIKKVQELLVYPVIFLGFYVVFFTHVYIFLGVLYIIPIWAGVYIYRGDFAMLPNGRWRFVQSCRHEIAWYIILPVGYLMGLGEPMEYFGLGVITYAILFLLIDVFKPVRVSK